MYVALNAGAAATRHRTQAKGPITCRRNCGADPRSARVPPDLSFGHEFNVIQAREADGGVGCGPGGPPHRGKAEGLLHNVIPHPTCDAAATLRRGSESPAETQSACPRYPGYRAP